MARRRVAALQEEGFEFSDEAAEWGRWYNELKEYRVKVFLRNLLLLRNTQGISDTSCLAP